MPIVAGGRQWNGRDRFARGPDHAKRDVWRAALGLHPHPTVISHALLQEHAPLSNTRVAAGDMEPHTAVAIVECHLSKLYLAILGERLPVRLEIFSLKTRAANLLSEEAIFDRVVYMLQELSIDTLADRRGSAVRIDQQHAHLRLAS